MYMRVALMMPLYFRVETPELTDKRERYKKIFVVVDLLVFATLCGTTTFAILIVEKDQSWYVPLFWSLWTMILTTVFGVSFFMIRNHTKGLAKKDKLGNRHLLYFHFGAFLASSVCSVAYSVCMTI